MRTLTWALVLAFPGMCLAAPGAEERLVPERTAIPLILLRQKSVQQELKLSDDLVKKVFEFTNKQHDAFQEARKLGKEERESKIEELEKENKQFLADNLTSDQQKRLDQIALQVTGLFQLTRPEVVKALNLTDAQLEKIRALQQEARAGLEKLLNEKDVKVKNQLLAERREETREKIMALMTDEQKAKIREMVGEPFKGEIVIEEQP
jgi:hypothetical protein